MFGNRGFENKTSNKETLSVDKAARILSLDEDVAVLVKRYRELQIDSVFDDQEQQQEVINQLWNLIKDKGVNLDENTTNIKDFVESYEHARSQNTGRRK